MNNFKEKMTLNPILTFLVLIAGVILLSGFLHLIGFEATYNKINLVTEEYTVTSESVESLLSLSGIKYIFSSTVANFTAFTPLSMMLIVLIGIGIMEKSGFLKTTFTILTKFSKRYTITFVLVLLSVLFSIVGDLGYVVMIPLAALLFTYGRRNPILGIVAVYAGLTCGSGISVFMSSLDSEMLNYTLASAHLMDPNYVLTSLCFVFIMTIVTFAVATLITIITERISANMVEKYEYKDEKKELRLGRREYRGLIFALIAGAIYLLIFIYNIIPGLPFSGKFLDYSQNYYIDKLFNFNSFFSNGFVFIITIFFIILGLFYGIGAKTIKNNNDFCEYLAHSLDGTGRTIIIILLGSILINIFKKSNIGVVLTISLANIIGSGKITGLLLIVALFGTSALSTLFLTGPNVKWAVLSTVAVPAFMNSSLSPEFAQLVTRFGECMTLGLTPLLAYFTIYIAYIEKYNQDEKPISFFKTLKYQIPFSIYVGLLLLAILLAFYLIGIPLGIGGVITT
jgi:aminobenzoyl-glutamate transport protein